jgi:hypothetical protein
MTISVLATAAAAAHHATLVSSHSAALVGELIRHLLARDSEVAPSLFARLEDGVHTYEVEFRGYLNGQGQRPPIELGATLVAAFVELAAAADRHEPSRFRVEALEARFHAAERLLTQRLERDDRRSRVGVGHSPDGAR